MLLLFWPTVMPSMAGQSGGIVAHSPKHFYFYALNVKKCDHYYIIASLVKHYKSTNYIFFSIILLHRLNNIKSNKQHT